MRILYTAPFDQEYLEFLKKNCGEVFAGVPEEDRLLSSSELINAINHHNPGVMIVEVNEINSTVLNQVNCLKVIAVCRTGVNNIDLQLATQKEILVINAPARNAVAVAEWTVALMINIARNFYQGANLIKNKSWKDMVKTCYELEGYELAGRTAGIIGVGSIGKEVARRLQCWNMKTIGYDPYVNQIDVEELGITMTPLETLLRESDFVILLAVVSDETRGMINQERIKLMKPTSYFINTARASLVDEESLLYALQTNKIAGAALDVHSEEPLPPDSPWITLDNVILTPHLGGATKDTITKHSRMIYDDLLLINQNKRPRNLVNSEVWASKKS